MDFIARFENLVDDLASIEGRIGVPINLSNIRAKGGHRRDKSDIASHYDSRLIDSVGRTFEKEITAFNYEPSF